MGKRGRKPIGKTIDDLEPAMRANVDEALRADCRESASSVFRRFSLAQQGLLLDTFIKYAKKLRQLVWTDEPPLDRETPTIEEIRQQLYQFIYTTAKTGAMKPYEAASLLAKVHQHDRLQQLEEVNERAQEKHDAWKEQVTKEVRAAVEAKTPNGETMTRSDVYQLVDDIMRGKVS